MYCRYCGSELLENAKFCTVCGKPVAEEQTAVWERIEPTRAEYFNAYSFYNFPYPYNYDYDYDELGAASDIPPFRSFLAQNILLTLFCCLPIGLFGVFHSVKALRFQKNDPYEVAWLQGQIAQTVFWSGLLLGSVYALFQLVKIGRDIPAFLEYMSYATGGANGVVW